MLLDKLQLESDEKILKMVRKHWLVITLELVGVAITALLPILFILLASVVGGGLGLKLPTVDNLGTLLIFGMAMWLLFSVFAGFMIWTHYYLDIWIITDRRIISVDQIHFFNRNVAIFRLERLQDIEFSIRGLIQTLFNYGTLSAQTAGHNEANFKSTGMPNPDELQNLIQKAMDARLEALNHRPSLSH